MPATLEPAIPPTDLLAAAAALDAEQFERLIGDMLQLRAGRKARSVGAEESALFNRINAGLNPELWDRYRQLQTRRQSLSSEDRVELIRLTDAVELYLAERASALASLAALRGQSLVQLMDSLGIDGPAPE